MQASLDAMVASNKFYVVPLPAIDKDDDVVSPHHYHEKLNGAVVRVTVTVSHQWMNYYDTDNYYADVQEIKILQRPLRIVDSPGKRKFDESLRNSKKRRLD